MTEKGVEVGDVSVEVKSRVEDGLEVKMVNDVDAGEVGSERDGKDDVHNDGVVTSGEDESDNSYVLVNGNGSDEMVEDVAERGDCGEVLVELNDHEVLVESSDPQVLVEFESKEDEGQSLDGGPDAVNEEDGKFSSVVENGASLSSKDDVKRYAGEYNQDETKTDIVEENEIVDKVIEQEEVENTSKVEEPIEAEYSNKLEDAQEAVIAAPYGHASDSQQVISGLVESGDAHLEVSLPNPNLEEKLDSKIETTELNEPDHIVEELEKEINDESSFDKKENLGSEDLVSHDARVDSMVLEPIEVEEPIETGYSDKLENVKEVLNVPHDHDSDSQQIITGAVETKEAVLEDSNPSLEEKLDSEIETPDSNKSEHTVEELKMESNDESFLNEKESQESEDLMSSDSRVNSMEQELAGDINSIYEPLSDNKVIVDENPQLSEEKNKLDNKSEVSSNIKENKICQQLVSINELDINIEEQNDSASILPVESNAACEVIGHEHDDVRGNYNDSVPSLDEIEKPEAASAIVLLNSTEQEVEYETLMDVNDDQTTEAKQTTSKDFLLNSIVQEQKELATDNIDGLHSDTGTNSANGSSPYRNDHDLAADVEVVEQDTDNKNSVVPTDNEWPELSCYNTSKKTNTESKNDERGSQESDNIISEEMDLAGPDRKEFHTVSPVDDNLGGHKKEVVDASFSDDSENACPDSGTSKKINYTRESTTWADDSDQTYGVSSPSVLSTCSHSLSDGVASTEVALKVEASTPAEEASSLAALENEVDRRPFFFLIKVPRFEDDDLREQIKFAQLEVEEKTKLRDSYRVPIQAKRDVCMDLNDDLETARLEEKVARDNLKAKRREIDAAQAVLDKVNNAMTVEDIDAGIRVMEHRMQHETVPLSEEKHLMREIKRLKHFREQLSSSIGTKEELQEALDQKDEIKDHLKSLKRELNLIRSDVQKAETVTKAAKKKCFDEFAELSKLQLEFKAADGSRQEAYMSLVSLRRELAQKNKLFRMYKDTERIAHEYALSGNRKALHSLCVNQVETVMEMWNTNDNFRKDYANCNARSTLRRLKTLDGRSLGLDEEPPSLPYVRNGRSIHSEAVTNSFAQIPSPEESKIYVPHIEEKIVKDPVVDSKVKKEAKKQSKSTRIVAEVSTVPSQELTQEANEEVKKTEEEEELAKKTEEVRKKEEEAKMMEQLQLEEKAKAKEALERKKRMAERAQARAKLRAKKEAEQREKEREKRLRKKEKRKDGNENDCTVVHESQAELVKETNAAEKQVTVPKTKRHHRPSDYAKATKTSTMPINLRNRHRRKMQMWMWIGLSAAAAVVVVILWFGLLSSLSKGERFAFGYNRG